ncbi:MAG: hypothetical protein NWE77_06640 [Candidatus Bathyarchaeota archaeon]|jgi:hypothetical protein|nr:hypothetical protein [Candidatus Bathyarchaeota archaeon]
MGSVRSTIKISTVDVLASNIDISAGVTLVADSGNVQRLKVLGTSAGASAQTLHKANEKLNRAYLYVKNLGKETEKYAYVYADTATDDPVLAKLAGGEFCFMPVDPAVTLKIYGTDVDQIVEFAVFGLDSSAVTYS